MSTDSSTQAQTRRVAKWCSSMCRSPHAHSLGAFRPREVDCTRVKDPRWYAPAGFSQGPAYKSRPGLFPRSGQIEVLGSGRRIGRQIDKRVEDLLMKVDRRLDVQAASPTAKMADSTCRQPLLLPKWQTRCAQVQFHSRQIHHCLSFGSLLALARLETHWLLRSVSLPSLGHSPS